MKTNKTLRQTSRKWVMSVLGMMFVLIANASENTLLPDYSNSELTATTIDPGVTVIETYDNTTMYLVEGDSASVLIDTGTKCNNLDKVISGLTNKPVTVVLTHGHYDHAGNIGFFPEVYMHSADSVLDTPSLKNYKGKIKPVNDGDSFDLGGRKLRVIHTPGHTPGSICLVDDKAGIAFTGDAFGSGQLWMQLNPQLPFSTLAESCGRMIEIMNENQVNRLYVGHYPYLKKALGINYLLDVAIACRRIDKGDTSNSVPFGTDGSMVLKHGNAEIVYRPENSNKKSIISPYVLLKLDDVHYGEGSDAVPPRWNKVLDYLREKQIKANFGIIGYSLTMERPDYLDWLKNVASKGDIEFWNHGYHNRMSLDEIGEFEQDYAAQYRALHLTDSLATACANIKLQAWGRHWTDYNEYTDSALSTVEGLNLIFGHPDNPTCFKGLVVPFNLEMEYPYHNPVYQKFLINYMGKWRNLKSFYLQGHPNAWDEQRWSELRQIIDRLLADEAQFITISDYISLVKNNELQ